MPPVSFPALKAANRLPSPPAVAMRILQLVASDDATLDELAHVIGADPALTAKILKYLHSPLLGLGFHGTTLTEAVARIGTRGAQLLALSFSLVSQKHQQSCRDFDFNRFWSESLARAVAARRLVASVRTGDPEEAFIAGLLLRIGQLVLATALPGEYEPVLSAAAGGVGSLEAHERRLLGTDHLEIGLQLLQDWKLPEPVCAAVGACAPGRDPAGDRAPASAWVPLADAIAAFLVRDPPSQGKTRAALLAQARLPAEEFQPMLEQVSQDWIAYGELLAIPTGKPLDLDALESDAEEYRTTLRLAAEVEVLNLRSENQQLSQLASRDHLTGLLNRGAFDDAVAAGLARAARDGSSLTLLMIDLDRFKSINDRHGHPVGDAVLRHFTRVLQECIAAPAEAFRHGGDEFAVLAPGVGEAEAVALAETLCRAIAMEPQPDAAGKIALTASIGLASARWPGHPRTPGGLVEAADRRLYEAKRAGGNACRQEKSASAPS